MRLLPINTFEQGFKPSMCILGQNAYHFGIRPSLKPETRTRHQQIITIYTTEPNLAAYARFVSWRDREIGGIPSLMCRCSRQLWAA